MSLLCSKIFLLCCLEFLFFLHVFSIVILTKEGGIYDHIAPVCVVGLCFLCGGGGGGGKGINSCVFVGVLRMCIFVYCMGVYV